LGNKEGAEEILEEIMSGTLSQAYPSPEIVQARYLELIMNLLRAAIESGIPSHKIADYSSEYVKKLFNSDTAHNMSKHMHELVTDLTDSIKASHSGKNLKMIQSAVNFIDENYSKDLCLEEAAQSIGLSSYYFSHLFKRETGQTFIEYLTKIRIEKAKKLLSETNLNVAEVSEKVGYQDPKYFSRVFKNIVGIPPSKFC
jgi:two-component system response regulator YesN